MRNWGKKHRWAALVPVLLALIPITILVMTVSGCVTQRLAERKEKKQ